MNQVVTKSNLRQKMRNARREHAAAQPEAIRGLLFNTPPRPLLAKIDTRAVIGLYHAVPGEAPAGGYARFFAEQGHTIALPQFNDKDAPMRFAEHTDPFAETDLEPGPFGLSQPGSAARPITPDIVFVPLVAFTAQGQRLGQGGGHYDRWLAEHPGRLSIGLAWDVQLVASLPVEPHDVALDAVVTPTRFFGLD